MRAHVVGVNVRNDPIRVPVIDRVEPDPDWSFVDGHGHQHRFDGDAVVSTIERFVVRTYWCPSCLDDHEEEAFRCRQCGELIVPRYLHLGPAILTLPGMTEATVDVEIWHDDRGDVKESKKVFARTEDEIVAIEAFVRNSDRAGLVAWLDEVGLL